MLFVSKSVSLAVVLAGALALSGCDSAEDRAESYYNRGLELVAAGEPDKAILEFRNALQINQDLPLPRLEYAKLLLERQDFQGAVGNFLKVIEVAPNNIDARLEVGQLLVGAGQFEVAMEHLNHAYELAPGNTRLRSVKAMGDYRSGNTEAGLAMAQGVLDTEPENITATMVMVSDRLDNSDLDGALSILEEGLTHNPDEMGLHLTKLSILERKSDPQVVGDQLKLMYERFPKDRSISTALVRWYVNQQDNVGAEQMLRDIALQNPEDREASLKVVAFLRETKGEETARVELERLARGANDQPFYQRALAAFDFRLGDSDAAIDRVKTLLDGGNLDDQELIDTKMTLADLYRRTGNTAGAATLFNEVLEEDPANVEGLRLRALNALDEDRPEDAITDLRAALNQDPDSAALMTILATAHERNGSPGLALERLSMAVDASSNGLQETLRYASFLAKQQQPDNAISVLEKGLTKRPNAPELLSAIARLHLSLQNWKDAGRIADQLDALGEESSTRAAKGIRIAAANGQQDFDSSIGMLLDMWAERGETTTAMENLVRTYVQTGEADRAIEFLSDLLAEDPTNLRANLLLGAVQASQGNAVESERLYRKVIADWPKSESGYSALASFLRQQGRDDEAAQVVSQGLENAPQSGRLMMAQAAREEVAGNFEAAIAIYDQLYEANPSNELLANNLASLLSDHRTDVESHEQAFAVAKRLRASEVPAYQDTYGWILYNRGEYERAVAALVKAAEGMPNNAIVAYHLGMTYAKLGQDEVAIETLQKAVELGAGQSLPQIESAAAELARLKAEQQ